jgi:hypothetical protein
MNDLQGDALGGWVSLQQLLAQGALPYHDRRQAKRFLDAHGVPFITMRRQRHYRPPVIRDALVRAEQRQLEEVAA